MVVILLSILFIDKISFECELLYVYMHGKRLIPKFYLVNYTVLTWDWDNKTIPAEKF